MSKSKQGGFTLIELVVVIVILGILAAFAVPRFMGLEGQARAATVKSLAGSLRSASAMAHGVWLANGGTGASITVAGTSYPMAFGYPTAVAKSIQALIEDTSGFTFTAGTFSPIGATDPTKCLVIYTAPTSATGKTSVPTISVPVVTGC